DDIRIQGSLSQKLEVIELCGFLLEHINKLVADNFPFLLRIVDAGQLAEESLPRVDLDHLHIELADEGFHDAIRFAFAQQTVINKHTGQIVADRLMNQDGYNGGVNTAGQGTE